MDYSDYFIANALKRKGKKLIRKCWKIFRKLVFARGEPNFRATDNDFRRDYLNFRDRISACLDAGGELTRDDLDYLARIGERMNGYARNGLAERVEG